MKSFKQYLRETTQTLNPRRSDYPEGDGGQQQYLDALRSTSQKQKQEAQEMTQDAESKANVLGKIETGLKAAETVTDVALSAGSVTPVGAALNAGVKGIKAISSAASGDYGSAAVNALDAAVPFAGKLATGVKGAANIAAVANNPIAGGVRVAAEKVGLSNALSTVASDFGVSSLAAKSFGKAAGSAVQKTTTALGNKISNEQSKARL